MCQSFRVEFEQHSRGCWKGAAFLADHLKHALSLHSLAFYLHGFLRNLILLN